jgi:hypothetical protein
MTFGSSPREHQREHGESAGAKRQSDGEAMFEMAESQTATCKRHPSFIRHKFQTKRASDGVLQTLLQQEKIGSTKASIGLMP